MKSAKLDSTSQHFRDGCRHKFGGEVVTETLVSMVHKIGVAMPNLTKGSFFFSFFLFFGTILNDWWQRHLEIVMETKEGKAWVTFCLVLG
jgi:hypothetical protein